MLAQANSVQIPLKDNSVHCCITSPPYFNLRSYLPNDDPLKAYEIGNEPTSEQYIANLVAVGREIWRVLRDDGVFWLNLGDSYAGNGNRSGEGEVRNLSTDRFHGGTAHLNQRRVTSVTDISAKNLMLIPFRVALALQADGWILRAACPWVKASGMPESCTDRPNVSHETVFLLSKSPRYYFDMDAVRVGLASSSIARLDQDIDNQIGSSRANGGAKTNGNMKAVGYPEIGRHWRTSDIFNAGLDDALLALEIQKARLEAEIAALKYARDNGGLAAYGDDPLAFLVNTRPYSGAHYAVFPLDLVAPMIQSSCPPRCCPECGAGWKRAVEREANNHKARTDRQIVTGGIIAGGVGKNFPDVTRITTGWRPTCSCNSSAETVSGLVLDPFAGSGTVGAACRELGREFIGLELNAKYISENAMARSERATSAAVMAQMPLFAGMETTE